MMLVKRYFDMIDSAGEYVIGYDAVARLGSASVRQKALISSVPTFNKRRLMLEGRADFEDFPKSMGFDAEVQWSGATEASPLPALEASAGPISWRLDAIGGLMTIRADGSELSGRGYLETVTLDDAPWKLGLRTIRWGRFVGSRHWAVWNVIAGELEFSFAAVDGASCQIERTDSDGVETALAKVTLGPVVHAVHEGDVLASQLPTLRPIIRALAGKFGLDQSKHVREAVLRTSAGEVEEGFVMDEAVLVAGERTMVGAAGLEPATRPL